MSELILDEMNEILKEEVVQRHSYFQLKHFVVGKEPTNQSKMWQCLRELKSRKESLDSLELEIEDVKDKIELLDISVKKIKLENESDELSIRESKIRIRQAERAKKAAEYNLLQIIDRKKWIEEEALFFLKTFKNIQKTEPLKHYDDLDSQKQYWTEKLSQKLNLKMLTSNHLDTELVETVVALPDDMEIKKQILATLSLRHANMANQLKDQASKIKEITKNEKVK